MHDTLSSLVERALTGNRRALEFYLRDNSRLPGPRANLELAYDVSHLLAAAIPRHPDNVYALLNYLANGDRKPVASNTPAEFTMLCGVIAYGVCAAAHTDWRDETFQILNHYACSPSWRVREGVAIAYQQLLNADPQSALAQLLRLATQGDCLQQRAAVAAVAEPPVLYNADVCAAALEIQRIVLERLRAVPADERKKNEQFRLLRRTLGYTLSVVTAAEPERGFALMRECAAWQDGDIRWILRENLGKKRLAKFVEERKNVGSLLEQSRARSQQDLLPDPQSSPRSEDAR
ncbi:MAG: hypothetical protein IMW89_01140 [Ktedonobacteraceae bacterium]|nr:hypothetical protein [Ktedonobacteraceae bacterium]